MFKSGFITIMGRVNVGKSTLLNFLVETKISIVSNKPNTTKEKILGVCNGSNYQFVFVDNPGLIYKNFKKLFMPKFNSVLLKNIDEVDVILFLVDSECRIEDKYFLNFLKKYQKKIILVISKIDILKNKTAIDKIILSYTQEFDFDAVVPISSVNKQNLEILKDNVLSLLNEGKLLFPIETKTNITQEKLITELLREKFFFYLDKELPHVCRNVLEKTELTEAQVPNVINVLIFVPKINQKKILIGHNGENLKKIRIAAQRDIKKVLKMKINLKLWVKIDSDSLRKQNVSL